MASSEETTSKPTVGSGSTASSVPPRQDTRPKPQVSSSGKVKITNRSNRNIELDFGRDKEVRIPARGTVEMDKSYLTHPKFLQEQSNLTVTGG